MVCRERMSWLPWLMRPESLPEKRSLPIYEPKFPMDADMPGSRAVAIKA